MADNKNSKSTLKTKKELDKFMEIKNVSFFTDYFEELVLQDLYMSDDDMKYRLHRDLSSRFLEWLNSKMEKKENIAINIKGSTRSGKSYIGLKIAYVITRYYNKPFNASYIVCSNQKEFRQKLQEAQFGDVFLIDENVFSDVGIGMGTEKQQLKDIQNIIAKKNIHAIYITPRTFLDTGAEIGLSYWGKDTKNWISRFLMYHLKGGSPYLLGYVMLNIGELYSDNGCYIFKWIGGCTNPQRYKRKDIPDVMVENSSCLSENKENYDDNLNACPFYNICSHALCKYEHKKDKWIKREMEGDLDERQLERYRVVLQLLKLYGVLQEAEQPEQPLEDDETEEENENQDQSIEENEQQDENSENNETNKESKEGEENEEKLKQGELSEELKQSLSIKLMAKSGKDLWNKVKLKISKLSSTKFTETEKQEIMEIVKSCVEADFLESVLHTNFPYINIIEFFDPEYKFKDIEKLNNKRAKEQGEV